ncbi:MAG TPA: flagellar basal body protein FliL [Gammaproteobacteria bacterium]|nr:flagellar basal body protein FliL [Gammaproteobacteria bacterium]
MHAFFSFKLIFLILIFFFPTLIAAEEDSQPKAIYYAFKDPFTINFLNQSKKRARYLQIKVSLKSMDPLAVTAAQDNAPMLEDALLELFTEQSFEQVNSLEGRQALQQSALEIVKTVLTEETGSAGIDAVYFTSFIIQ